LGQGDFQSVIRPADTCYCLPGRAFSDLAQPMRRGPGATVCQLGQKRTDGHEVAYILLRDKNPDYIRALMAPNAMTIPARLDEGGTVARQEEPGPVFSIMPTGDLHMRYTIRVNNVMWAQDTLSQEALSVLQEILNNESPYIYRGRLESGMGLVSNNVLHDRAAFTDDARHKRHYYRARYFDRLAGTHIADIYDL